MRELSLSESEQVGGGVLPLAFGVVEIAAIVGLDLALIGATIGAVGFIQGQQDREAAKEASVPSPSGGSPFTGAGGGPVTGGKISSGGGDGDILKRGGS